MNQPPRNGNPLRGLQSPQATPIRDSSVRPASWQEQSPQVSSDGFRINRAGQPKVQPNLEPNVQPSHEIPALDPTTQTAPSPTSTDNEPQAVGPAIGPDMKIRFQAHDSMTEITPDNLEQEIAKRRADINASLGIDADANKNRLQQLSIAEEASKRVTQHIATKDDYQRRIMGLNEGLERLRLEAKKSVESQSVDRQLSIDAMQTRLRNLEAELKHEKANVVKTLDKIQTRDKRMATIPGERLERRNEVSKLHEELMRQHAVGTSDVISLLAIRARELAEITKVESLEQEESWYGLSQEWLPLEKTIQQRQIERLELEVKSWNAAVARKKQVELEKQIQLARGKVVEAQPSLRELSEQTTLLTQARKDLATKISELRNESLRVNKQKDDVKNQRTELESSIEKIGKDDSSALLIQVHRNLIRPYKGMARVREMESELRLSRGKILQLRNEQEPLSHPEAYIKDTLDIHQDVTVAGTTLIALANEAIETHRQQLTALEADNDEYQKLLNEVLPSRKSLLAEIKATRELVDTHAMWIQSSDPISLDVLQKSREGANEFFDPDQWRELRNSIVGRMRRRPYESAVGMCGLLIAFAVGRRFKG